MLSGPFRTLGHYIAWHVVTAGARQLQRRQLHIVQRLLRAGRCICRLWHHIWGLCGAYEPTGRETGTPAAGPRSRCVHPTWRLWVGRSLLLLRLAAAAAVEPAGAAVQF